MGLLLTAHLAEQRCSILPSGQLGGGHSFCLIIRYQEPSSDLHWEILTENNLILISCLGPRKSASPLGRTNLSKSGPNEPDFFSWVWVHALMAVITLTLSLVKYLLDAVDFCETEQLPL